MKGLTNHKLHLKCFSLFGYLVFTLLPLWASSSHGSGTTVTQVDPRPLPIPAGGTVLYVAPNGSGVTGCSITAPCSISLLSSSSLVTGTTVYLRGGFYYLTSTITPSSSGPIVYQAYPGEVPVITGAQPIGGWTKVTGSGSCAGGTVMSPYSCWKTTIPSGVVDFDFLIYVPAGSPPSYVTNVIARRTQSVNTPTGYMKNAYSSNMPTTNLTVEVNSSDIKPGLCTSFPCSPYNANDIKFYNFYNWNVDVLRIDGSMNINGSPPSISFAGTVGTPNGFAAFGRYLIVNSKEYFAVNGSSGAGVGTFYIDCGTIPGTPGSCVSQGTGGGSQHLIGNATIYYIAYPSETPSADLILAPQLAQIVSDVPTSSYSNSASNLTFHGLVFIGDNYVVPDSGYPSYQSEPNIPAALSFVDSLNVVVDSSTIAHTSGWGLEFTNDSYPGGFPNTSAGCEMPSMTLCDTTASSANNQLSNSALYDIGASGLRLGRIPPNGFADPCHSTPCDSLATNNTTVTNNIFDATGRMYPAGEDGCISINSSHHNTIKYNDCVDSYGGGINIGPGPQFMVAYVHDNNIEFNHFSKLGEGVISDFGCVYVANGGCTGDTAPGVSCGDTFQNNICHDITHALGDFTVSNGGTGIYLDHNSQNVMAKNNLVYRTSGALNFNNHGCLPVGSCTPGNVIQGNIFAHSYQGAIKRGPASGSYTGDAFLTFTFQNNIIYFDNTLANSSTSGPQWLNTPSSPPGAGTDSWTCTSGTGVGTVPCTQWFLFQNNDYWTPNSSNPLFYVTDSTGYPADGYTGDTGSPGYPVPWSQWRSCVPLSTSVKNHICEDSGSIFQDPLFVNPNYPFDQYQLQSGSPAPGVGFNQNNSFLPTYGAGRGNPAILPPTVGPGFPVQLLSPTQF
jgi:hypothetical protein